VREGMERGVVFGSSRYRGLGNVVKIKPPVVISESQIGKVLEVFEDIMRNIQNRSKKYK
jgi:4-aminobutyrate aminotransferase-like enzyme